MGGILCLFLGTCASPKQSGNGVESVTEPWREVSPSGQRTTTEHFQVYSTLQDQEFAAAVPALLEAGYTQFSRSIAPRRTDRLTCYIFGCRREWAAYVEQNFPARFPIYARIRQGGFTEGDTSTSFYVSRAQTAATLLHEAWHQYVAVQCDVPIPAWLNEGLACWHEAVEFVEGRPRFTPERNTIRMGALRDAVHKNTLIPLSRLVDTDAGEVLATDDGRYAETYYAQAWALVSFLRTGENTDLRRGFDQLLTDVTSSEYRKKLSAGRLTSMNGKVVGTDGAAAFETYFGVDPEALQAAYFNHVVQLAGF